MRGKSINNMESPPPEVTETVSILFNADDCDVILRSCDNVLFKVHRKNLETHSGTLADAESISSASSSSIEVVDLTETSAVLEILLQFMYPRPAPDLSKIEFSLLADVAEAVEKYQVFYVTELCKYLMRDRIPSHPFEVLVYAARHGIVDIMDAAAPTAVFKRSWDLKHGGVYGALIQYDEGWRKVLAFAYRTGPRNSHMTDRGTWCDFWLPCYADVCYKLGCHLGSLQDLDDVFSKAVQCRACAAMLHNWKLRVQGEISALPKFSTFM